MGTLWVQCPVAATVKVVAAGKIHVGWTMARVESLSARPLQCFRCLERGHVREQCSSQIDRSGCCYNCGSSGHKASNCVNKTHCVLCTEAGLPAGHRVGSEACRGKKGVKTAKKGKNGGQAVKKGGAEGGPGDGIASPGPSRGDNIVKGSGGAGESSGDGLASPGLTPNLNAEAPKPQRPRRVKSASAKQKESGVTTPAAQPDELREVVMVEA
ncbi:putative 50 kDa protein in type I retrotransposable element R1DM [Formica fusca]